MQFPFDAHLHCSDAPIFTGDKAGYLLNRPESITMTTSGTDRLILIYSSPLLVGLKAGYLLGGRRWRPLEWERCWRPLEQSGSKDHVKT